MLELFCYNFLLAGMESFVPSNQNIDQYSTSKLSLLDEYDQVSKISRLSQTLEMINELDDSEVKVTLLNNLALSYAKLGELEQAKEILAQSLSITENFEDITLKVTTITEIAHAYSISHSYEVQ
ncbi:tetratricopeptide repeat protein [Crocosphaera sp. Alani8]|uniref:tetratricopeptide repeat protein n=1 Tax=Crocosphaera sp. Alani8 TaxID=3038952 RepID=UPI00313E7CFF